MGRDGFEWFSRMSWLFRSVNLSWAVPGDNNSPITAYIIAYKKYLGNKIFHIFHSVIYISRTIKKMKTCPGWTVYKIYVQYSI
jgi:hypothetical protein